MTPSGPLPPVDPEAPPETVRSRARRVLRAEVSAVAMDLFRRQGFDSTTVEQIVAAAGMSRSTFFRYFATKEDVVLSEVVAYGERIAAALSQRPPAEPIWTALRAALDPLIHPDGDEQARQVNRMFNSSPSLKARHHEKTLTWQRLLIPEIARRLSLQQAGEGDPRPAALAASALACYDAAIASWISPGNDTPLAALLDAAMHAVRPDGAPAVPADSLQPGCDAGPHRPASQADRAGTPS